MWYAIAVSGHEGRQEKSILMRVLHAAQELEAFDGPALAAQHPNAGIYYREAADGYQAMNLWLLNHAGVALGLPGMAFDEQAKRMIA